MFINEKNREKFSRDYIFFIQVCTIGLQMKISLQDDIRSLMNAMGGECLMNEQADSRDFLIGEKYCR